VTRLELAGLETRPGQVWGGVRLVPLIRAEPIGSLRLHPAALDAADDLREHDARHTYTPHGLTAEWTGDGTAVPALGTALQMQATTVRRSRRPKTKHERRTRVRFVSHRTALDAYLPLSFRVPTVAWSDWKRLAYQGMPEADEPWYGGWDVQGLRDALRVFEIHPGQCGVLVYAADALAGAFVTPHPDDYKALHPSLVEDRYGELIARYSHLHPAVPEFAVRLDAAAVDTVADLRAQVAAAATDWAGFHDGTMASGLLGAEYRFTEMYRMDPFTLRQFRPADLSLSEGHVGEAITAEDGSLAFLHTFRLSETQLRRGRLLEALAGHDWHLEETAAGLDLSVGALGVRIQSAGFGALLHQHALDHYRAMDARFGR
jgi:hypothetical protein